MGSFGQIWAQPQTPNDAQFCPIVHNWGRKILEARFRRPQPALVVRRILTPMNWVPLTTTRRWRAKRAPPRYNLERSEGTRTTMSLTTLAVLAGQTSRSARGPPDPPPPPSAGNHAFRP